MSPQDPDAHVELLLWWWCVREAFASEPVLQPCCCMPDTHGSHQLRRSHCNVHRLDKYLSEPNLLQRRLICSADPKTEGKYFSGLDLVDQSQTPMMNGDA